MKPRSVNDSEDAPRNARDAAASVRLARRWLEQRHGGREMLGEAMNAAIEDTIAPLPRRPAGKDELWAVFHRVTAMHGVRVRPPTTYDAGCIVESASAATLEPWVTPSLQRLYRAIGTYGNVEGEPVRRAQAHGRTRTADDQDRKNAVVLSASEHLTRYSEKPCGVSDLALLEIVFKNKPPIQDISKTNDEGISEWDQRKASWKKRRRRRSTL